MLEKLLLLIILGILIVLIIDVFYTEFCEDSECKISKSVIEKIFNKWEKMN